MSFRVMRTGDPKSKAAIVTSTIDAAIEWAKKYSKTNGVDYVVRDGDVVRVWARNGKAAWVKTCGKCEGLGRTAALTPYSTTEECNSCKGFGFHQDLPCA